MLGTTTYDCEDLQAMIGDSCDDNNPETENDTVTEECECVGTPITYDCPELAANIGDSCDDGNENTTDDLITVLCECTGTAIYDCEDLQAFIGDNCNDNNPETVNDTVTEDCECIGTSISYDCPELTANIGDSCDDGNENTFGDEITGLCECVGSTTYDCEVLQAMIGDSCDDNNPETESDTVTEDCECLGTLIYDCQDLQANIGDFCNDGSLLTTNDIITDECLCVGTVVEQEECDSTIYFLADYTSDSGTDIYQVDINGLDGIMHLVANINDEVSIAYSNNTNLIYAVSKNNNAFSVLNPYAYNPVLSAPRSFVENYGQITGAAFSPNGDLLFSSQSNNTIYRMDVTTEEVSVYQDNLSIYGGDIAIAPSGLLYMSTNDFGGTLYQINPDSSTSETLLSSTPINTGLAATDTDQLLLSVRNSNNLKILNLDGTSAGTYNLFFNGEAFTLNYGDLASGCNSYEEPGTIDCNNLVTYYAQYNPATNESKIYTVDFDENSADLTLFSTVNGNVSIAYDGSNSIIYNIEKTTAFTNGLNLYGISAAVFNPLDGLVYIGDDITNAIYSLDPISGDVQFFADGFVRGGDLVRVSDGAMYLATQTGNGLYEVDNIGGSDFIGTIPALVTGAAQSSTPMGIVLSNVGSFAFTEINAMNAVPSNVYPSFLEGEPFQLSFGDMASDCADGSVVPTLVTNLSTIQIEQGTSVLTSMPNPTSGLSQAIFKTAETGRSLLEVFDVNGRNIAVLFDEEAEQGKEYRRSFNGIYLPNGIYVYRLTTKSETVIDKFMIAK